MITLGMAVAGIACGYAPGLLWFPNSAHSRNTGPTISGIPAPVAPEGSRTLETTWQAALSKRTLDQVNLVKCAGGFLSLSESGRAAALQEHEGEAGEVLEWFAKLHRAAMTVDSMPPPEKPVGTRAEFNQLLATSPDAAASQLRRWLSGDWSEKAYAFALLARSDKSPGLARLCVANPDLLMAAIDPELPLRSVCQSKELSFREARQFVEGIKGDWYRRVMEGSLNIRAYEEGLIPAHEYIGFEPAGTVRLARLRLWARDAKSPSQESMDQIMKLFAGTPNEADAAKILAGMGYPP